MGIAAVATDAEVRRVAEEVLAREEYARWRVEEHPLVLLLERVIGWLDGFLDWSLDLSAASPLLGGALLAGLLLLAVALLAHVVWAVRAALRAPPPPREPRRRAEDGPSLRARAEALAGAGRLLEAARELQLATLELLIREGWIELGRSDPNRTLRERLRRAALPEPERGELLRLLERLEALWFRDRVNDPDLYRAWRRLLDRLEALPASA